MSLKAAQSILHRRRFNGWILAGTALVSFATGSLFAVPLAHLREVRADNDRVFELMIYHTVPGKVSALESIIRDVAKLQAKYDLNAIGYWIPNEDSAWKDTFVYASDRFLGNEVIDREQLTRMNKLRSCALICSLALIPPIAAAQREGWIVPNRTMVAKFDHRSALLVSELTGFVAKKR